MAAFNALGDLRNFRELRQLRNIRHIAPRTFYPRIDQWAIRDETFRKKYRLTKGTARYLIALLQAELELPTRRGIPVDIQVLAALRYYATGSFQTVVGELNGIGLSQSSISRIVRKVSLAIVRLRGDFIKFSEVGPEELRRMKVEFFQMSGFPNVIGAIDGTHIPICNHGGEDEDVYINRKGFRSLNVQVVCDAKGIIRNVVARWPGSCHDSRIFQESSLYQTCERGIVGILLGDNGYPCFPYLLTPLLNPATPAERRYNTSHKRTRRIVESKFGR